MMLNVVSFEEAMKITEEKFSLSEQSTERLSITECIGRITAEDIAAGESIPPFDRSTVDGYALRASDTFGAGESIPAMLDIKGEILMGEQASQPVSAGECVKISTGGMLPEGADSVVMVEHTEQTPDGICLAFRAVSPFQNVTRKGDDVKKGQTVIKKGTPLSSRHIGILCALGITEVLCTKKIRVGIISSGDEIVPVEECVPLGKIRDINSHFLSALMSEKGCETTEYGIVRDDFDSLYATLQKAADECDVVLISGGSSAGSKDMTATVIQKNGEVFFHGIAVKPGKPTISGRVGKAAVFGLPGHPAAAYLIALTVVLRLIRKLTGEDITPFTLTAELTKSISSNHGREELVPVILKSGKAEPLFFKSGLVSLLCAADGYIIIPRNKEGLFEGEKVSVHPF
ncbi:MAG: molybdopterin molybdotransferase MoeA [Ruminococcaceae bacterium]|nr:molybdopterin molybdotransferase MoeA [Oscillospiraceae bacterium]